MTFAQSFSEWARLQGKDLLICYSKLDHPAVTSLSETYFGPHVKFFELAIDQGLAYQHRNNFEAIQDKKENNPDLIVLYHHLWVHNETGVISPLEELKIFKSIPDFYIHVDAVQSPGKILDWRALKVGDIFTFSAHKFGALKGVGFSFQRKEIKFHPMISGGGQQQGLRSGTENVTGVQSIFHALSDLLRVDVAQATKLRQEFEIFLDQELVGIGERIGKNHPYKNSNTIYFYLCQHTSDISLALFDLNGVMISAGSACSSGAAKESMLLLHLGLKTHARHGLRLSFNPSISEEEMGEMRVRFKRILSKLRS